MLLSLSGFGKGFPGLCRICIRVLLAAAIRIYFTVVYTTPLTFQFDQAAAILEHLAAHTHTRSSLRPPQPLSRIRGESAFNKNKTTFPRARPWCHKEMSRTEVRAQAAVYLEPDLYTRNHFSMSRTELRAQAVVYREEPRRSSGLRSHAAPFPPMLLSQSPGVCRAVTLLGPRIALTSPARATPFHAIPSKTQVEDDAREFTRVSQPQSAGAP